MLQAVNALFELMFGSILTQWVTCEPVMYVIGILIMGLIIKFVITLVKH